MKMSDMRRLVILVMALTFISTSAFARGINRRISGENPDATNAISAETQRLDQSHSRSPVFALGYTVGGMIRLSEKDFLQPFLVIPGTSPFQISSAIAYKRLIASSPNAGFHIGAGLGFGSVPSAAIAGGSSFNFTAGAITGLVFRFAGTPNIQIHVDGGPCFQTAGGTSNFTFDLLSASAVYWF
jgi:hypothetical protein